MHEKFSTFLSYYKINKQFVEPLKEQFYYVHEFVVENDQYRTKTVNDLIKLSHSFTDHFENKKTDIIKKLSDYAGSVPRAGLEPACPCEHRCLRPARLPIPPPGQ